MSTSTTFHPNKTHNKQRGLTLIELLVSMAVSIFILMAALSVLGDFLRSQGQFRLANSLLTTSENLFNELTLEMHQSSDVQIFFEGLILLKPDGTRLVYQVKNGQITKTGYDNQGTITIAESTITPPDIKVIRFESSPRSPQNATPLIEINLQLDDIDARNPGIQQLNRQTTISLRPNKTPNEF